MSKKHDMNEFKEVCDLLINAEVNDAIYKEKIYHQVKSKIATRSIQNNYRKRDEMHMKKNFMKSIAMATIGVVCLLGGLSTTAYGQEVIGLILARFQVGGIEITQYDKELPEIKSNDKSNTSIIRGSSPKRTTIEEARTVMKKDFPVPIWLPDGYVYLSSVLHSENGVELQYSKSEGNISLLISKGENGISTTGEVKEEIIGGKTVYFANGIVLWEEDGLNYELYHMGEDLDLDTLRKIINTMTAEKSYKEAAIYTDATEEQKAAITERTAEAAPPNK
jgi:hypothetical protein